MVMQPYINRTIRFMCWHWRGVREQLLPRYFNWIAIKRREINEPRVVCTQNEHNKNKWQVRKCVCCTRSWIATAVDKHTPYKYFTLFFVRIVEHENVVNLLLGICKLFNFSITLLSIPWKSVLVRLTRHCCRRIGCCRINFCVICFV